MITQPHDPEEGAFDQQVTQRVGLIQHHDEKGVEVGSMGEAFHGT